MLNVREKDIDFTKCFAYFFVCSTFGTFLVLGKKVLEKFDWYCRTYLYIISNVNVKQAISMKK